MKDLKYCILFPILISTLFSFGCASSRSAGTREIWLYKSLAANAPGEESDRWYRSFNKHKHGLFSNWFSLFIRPADKATVKSTLGSPITVKNVQGFERWTYDYSDNTNWVKYVGYIEFNEKNGSLARMQFPDFFPGFMDNILTAKDIEKQLSLVKTGMSESQVISILGNPCKKEQNEPPDSLAWSYYFSQAGSVNCPKTDIFGLINVSPGFYDRNHLVMFFFEEGILKTISWGQDAKSICRGITNYYGFGDDDFDVLYHGYISVFSEPGPVVPLRRKQG